MMTKRLKDKTPTEDFNCTDTIYAYVRWEGLHLGKHTLEAHWIDPLGKQQEFSVYNFDSPVIDSWIWLKLDQSKYEYLTGGGSTLSGYWNVNLFLDGKFLIARKFNVAC